MQDLVRIDPRVLTHRLIVDLNHPLVHHKRRNFTREWHDVINAEVDKLLGANYIREV